VSVTWHARNAAGVSVVEASVGAVVSGDGSSVDAVSGAAEQAVASIATAATVERDRNMVRMVSS
jgi:hypothetical protein